MSYFLSRNEYLEEVDDAAADGPLWALRTIPDHLSAYRLDACALAEPLAALTSAYDLLTDERRAACEAACPAKSVRYIPDHYAPERMQVLRRAEGRE